MSIIKKAYIAASLKPKKMKTKKVITMAVLSIFSLSILFSACTKTKYVEKEVIKEKVIRLCTREQAIQMAQEHKNKGTAVPEKDHPNDNKHKRTDEYIYENESDFYRWKVHTGHSINRYISRHKIIIETVVVALFIYGSVRLVQLCRH